MAPDRVPKRSFPILRKGRPCGAATARYARRPMWGVRAMRIGAGRLGGIALAALAGLLIGMFPTTDPVQAQEVEVVRGGTTPVTLDQSTGTVLRFQSNVGGVFVANPDIADLMVMSDQLIYVYGRSPGRTDVVVTDGAERVLGTVTLTVRLPVGELGGAIRRADPNSNVTISTNGNGLVLDGQVSDPAAAARIEALATASVPEGGSIVNRTSLAGNTQVMLRVRFAEVERTLVQRIGVNWGNITRLGSDFYFGLTPFSGNALSTTNAGSNALQFSASPGDINVLIDALEQEGGVTTLAEPSLTAVSGELASFLAGGEFPIPVAQQQGQTTIEYRQFGVSLNFRPQVIGPNRISLYVRPEVSTLSNTQTVQLVGLTIPAINIRRAETTVELGSGQTFAIAGLFQRRLETTRDNTPLFGDLPILGPLFRSERFERDESELVILITPYIVAPLEPEMAVLPTDPPDRIRNAFSGPPETARLDTVAAPLPVALDGAPQMTGFILK